MQSKGKVRARTSKYQQPETVGTSVFAEGTGESHLGSSWVQRNRTALQGLRKDDRAGSPQGKEKPPFRSMQITTVNFLN